MHDLIVDSITDFAFGCRVRDHECREGFALHDWFRSGVSCLWPRSGLLFRVCLGFPFEYLGLFMAAKRPVAKVLFWVSV